MSLHLNAQTSLILPALRVEKRRRTTKRAFPDTHDLTATVPVAIPTVLSSRLLQATALLGICNIKIETRGLVRGNDDVDTASQRSRSLLGGKSLCGLGRVVNLVEGLK